MRSSNLIVLEFISTNKLLSKILQEHGDSAQLLEKVLLEITLHLGDTEVNFKLIQNIDQAIIKGHSDQNLFLLFIEQAICYYCRFNQLEKANSICSIASTLSFKSIEPYILAIFTQSKARILRLEGKNQESLKVLEESITLVDKNFPKYYLLYHNYLYVIATLGKLKKNGVYERNPYQWLSIDEEILKTTELKLMNAVRVGDFEDGFQLLGDYKTKYGQKLPPEIEDYGARLQIISGDFNPLHYDDAYFSCMAKAYQYFSNCRFEEAIQSLKEFSVETIRIHNLIYYTKYLEIHYELCMRRSGQAQLLLQEKLLQGDFRYIDDLFVGRIQLLEKDFDGAHITFGRLSENVKRYGAINRLNFELQFVKEMSLNQILKLMKGWDSRDISMNQKIMVQPKLDIKPFGIKLIKGSSKAICVVKDLIKKYTALKAPILVTGETGTGKELVSRAIHEEGFYAKEPFLAINCGALTDTLLQSELFGYEAGAFTGAQKQRKGIFESAGKGTVFLDEFGDITPKLQNALLRVLESNEIRMIGSTVNKKIECKIVIATNVDLQKAVVEKKFREDLFFRLTRFEIKLPALRDRKEDLPFLIDFFLNLNNSNGRKKLSNELLNSLINYHWPGNIRELKNEIDRLYILNPAREILELSDFDFTRLQKPPLVNDNMPVPTSTNITSFDLLHQIMQSGFRLEQRHDLIISLFQKYKKVTRKQLIEITKVCPATISNDLKVLMQTGKIVRRTPTKSPRSHFFELS